MSKPEDRSRPDPGEAPSADDRRRRQAEALRDNLRKRKAQARGRQSPTNGDAAQADTGLAPDGGDG